MGREKEPIRTRIGKAISSLSSAMNSTEKILDPRLGMSVTQYGRLENSLSGDEAMEKFWENNKDELKKLSQRPRK